MLMLCSLPLSAQLGTNGYYRIRNSVNTSDYIALTNNLLDYDVMVITAGGGGTALATNKNNAQTYAMNCARKYLQTDIHLVEDANKDIPATVIYIKKYNGSYYDFMGQSVSLEGLTHGSAATNPAINFYDIYVEINRKSGSGANAKYTAAVELVGHTTIIFPITKTLGVHYFYDDDGVFNVDKDKGSASVAQWYIEPVTSLNVTPTVSHRGRYYATMYVPFAYKLDGDVVSAYVIKSINNDGTLEKECIATKDNGKAVPAGTPVVLECVSNTTANCNLLPQGEPRTDNQSSYTATTNLLKGTYFCNTDGVQTFDRQAGGTGTFNANNYQARNDSQMRVLGEVNGRLGFFLCSGDKMKANKVWLDVSNYQGSGNVDFTFDADEENEKGGYDE